MCDGAESTKRDMQRGYPMLFQHLSLYDLDTSCPGTIDRKLTDFIQKLEKLLPDENKECLIYALMLVERGFSLGVFLHSTSVKR